MSEQTYTPEQVSRSLRICHGAGMNAEGCIFATGDTCGNYTECKELESIAADLIDSQAAEIVRLNEIIEDRTKDVNNYAEQ